MVSPFVAFDLDGTLFDSSPLTIRATSDVLREFGVGRVSDREVTAQIGHPIEHFDAWLAGKVGDDDAARAQARFRTRQREVLGEEARLYDGVASMLDRVRGLTGAIGLYTNARKGYASMVCEQTGLEGRFDVFRPRRDDDVDKSGILAAVARAFGVQPGSRAGSGLVVGDRRADVTAGRDNGLTVIGAGYGFGDAGELEDADAIATSPADIAGLVSDLLAV